MKNIVVLGCGGIGMHLAQPLVRFLEHSDVPATVYFVDPDVIERENLARQYGPSTVGMGKATALVKLMTEQLQPKKVKLVAVPEAFSPKTIKTAKKWYWQDEIDVFVGVDNHATRLFAQQEALRLRDVALFIGGNEVTDGQCQIFLRHDGKNLTPTIDAVHPEMADKPGRFPDDLSCLEAAAHQPQLVFANLMAATSMLCAWWTMRWRPQADPTVNEVVFDVVGPTMRPLWNKALK
jgi:molybdopterin/thiamine biosynthesis adenylyltransferase